MIAMEQYPFIFSGQLKYRLLRHVSFWVCWWIFCSIIYAYLPVAEVLPLSIRLLSSTIEALIFLPIHIFVAYSMMYVIVPYLLIKGHYFYSVVAVGILFLITGVFNAFLSPHVGSIRDLLLDPILQHPLPKRYSPNSFYYSIMAGLRGGITVGGIAAAIKLMKHWFLKEQRNLQLQKENSEAQLQLLKAQVHPHFLFNTMNNIYSFTQNTAPVAAKMVSGLSGLLRFIIYEGNKPLVALRKEIKMLEDYIALEQVRYGNRLEIHKDIPEDTSGLFIAPLLLLPLVENCFKHGASNMVEQPWINLQITVQGDTMTMKLVNGKAVDRHHGNSGTGIGLQNVQQRLSLLYPRKHWIKITNEEEVFIIDLKIELEKLVVAKEVSSAGKQITVDA